MIVDAHVHIFEQLDGMTGSGRVLPLGYGRAQIGSQPPWQFMPPSHVHTSHPVEMYLGFMDWAGVERAVLMQGPIYGDMNEYYHRVVQQHPDRFIPVGLVDPTQPGAPDLTKRLIHDYGFQSIKLEMTDSLGLCSRYPDFNLLDPRFEFLWQAVSDAGKCITLDLGAYGDRSYQTDEVRQLVQRYPDVRWIIAHMGQPKNRMLTNPDLEAKWREQILLGKFPNVWFDLSSLPHHLPEGDYPFPGVNTFVRKALELIGAEKLLWATDVPGTLSMLTYPQMVSVIRDHVTGLSERDKQMIMGENALVAYG